MVKNTWLTGIFLLIVSSTFSQKDKTVATKVLVPSELADTLWLERLRDAQLAKAENIGVFHDFTFTDALASTRKDPSWVRSAGVRSWRA